MTGQGGPEHRLETLRRGLDRLRRDWRSWLTSRTGAGVLTSIVVVALIMTAASNGLPLPSADPSQGPSATPGTTATPGPSAPPDEAWGTLDVPAWEPIAELRPVDVDTSGVAVGSAFTLRSRTDAPAVDLATGLTAEPAIEFSVRPGATAAEATLIPSAPLAEGLVYRFRLADPSGALAGSWAYRTARPLHVVGSVPGDQTTGVPVDTGIEVEFDQDGVIDLGDRFSIQPAVAGRFEVHGRTIAFIPGAPLAAATIYRVTIEAGVTMTGSDQVLEAPVTFAFETTGTNAPASSWDVGLGRPILEATPGEAPVIGVDIAEDEPGSTVASLPFEVYRLASFEAARSAAIILSRDAGWSTYAADSLVDTTGLPRVARFEGTFESTSPHGYRVVRFPAPLDAGWYLVVVPRDGRDRQALLQVTTLSAYALTSETRTLAWVNDTATDAPIPGAEVSDPAGRRIGVTGANGLLDLPTPASLDRDPAGTDAAADAASSILTVTAPDGRRLLVALGLRSNAGAYDWARNETSQTADPARRWWRLFTTDRTVYRTSDTIHAWGLLRSRSDGSVPRGLELTIRTPEGSSTDGPFLARVPVSASARGAWAADLPIEGLPRGGYILEIRVAGSVAASTWIAVDEIRKPAYQIEVETDQLAVIAGEPLEISARATFFDGTPVAGLELRVEAFDEVRTATANADGRISVTVDARTGEPGIDHRLLLVKPVNPEEGELVGTTAVLVFPSSSWIEASGTVSGGRVVLDGTLSRIDLTRVEEELAAGGWPEHPAGAPLAGVTVTVRLVEMVTEERQVGTTYDYLEKRVIPLFEYTTREVAVGTYTTTSGPAGAVSLSIAAPTADGSYLATITARDAAGRTATSFVSAAPEDAGMDSEYPVRPYLQQALGCGGYVEEHAVGDRLELTMHDGDGAVSTGGRYLFVVSQGGIRDAGVQSTATLTRTFTESDLPNLTVQVIRFQDGTYIVTNTVFIHTRRDERTLGIEITADRTRYAPGDAATLTVRTSDADGDPVATDVVLRAVDEKLFEIGGAVDIDALQELLAPVGDGLLQSYQSHPLPMPPIYEGCGDTTGGGRDDFRDSALFELVSTGADGRASVTFDLPDDLTSWHVSATALAADLRAGDGAILLPVGLPFFADAILASDYLVGEQPVLRVRSFGDDLASGDRVRFTISSPDLLLAPTTVDAAAFATASLELPNLSPGVHEVTIAATVIGDPSRKDALVRRIVVRTSRLEVATSQLATLGTAGTLGGDGLTTYVVTDAGRGSLVPILQDLAYGGGARADRLLAADLARDLLVAELGFDAAGLPQGTFDLSGYQRGGIAILPFASTDLTLTALMAVVAPERIDREMARVGLIEWRDDPAATGERSIIALAGLAGLGDDVLDELHAIDVTEVTVREALWVALGLVASGDEDGARDIERGLLTAYGQAFGPWVRLDVGDSLVETLDAAALLWLVAAGIGDPLAPSIGRYVHEVPTDEAVFALHEIGAVRSTIERLPRTAARFAWTVDGERHEVALAPGDSWTVSLTERQRGGFRLERLEGAVAVVAAWSRVPTAGDLPSGDLVTIARTVTPAGTASATGLVKVTLRVTFAPTAPTGCWDVSDRTPSGLAPLASVYGWPDDESDRPGAWPYEVSGQEVRWCLDPIDGRSVTLSYAARVVSPGTFTWEPAVVQSVTAPDVGATTPVGTYTIR